MELGRLLLLVRLLLLPLLQQAPLVANMPSTSVAWSSSVLMGGRSGLFARRTWLASHPEGSTFPPSIKSRSTRRGSHSRSRRLKSPTSPNSST
ncbi:hypothetical protein EDB89DRAFT_2003767 [Lactarius sanguifluus]|nr:hypothetical protein EDB89DRAFT_2003767 [Lactarius sanguifluus]